MKCGNRRLGRILALKILFGLDRQVVPLGQIFEDFWSHFRFADDALGDALDEVTEPLPAPARHFAEELVLGVSAQRERIDAFLSESATNWSLERMAQVDRAILQVAVFELLGRPDIPARVIINEAIEIGKRFGAKETPAFVNGILDRIAQQVRTGEA